MPATLARRSNKPPVCAECFGAFLSAFQKVNKKVAPDERLSKIELEEKAARRAQAVRFGPEWACPRHTKFQNEKAQEVMLKQAYPNRAARRLAGGSTKGQGRANRQRSNRARLQKGR